MELLEKCPEELRHRGSCFLARQPLEYGYLTEMYDVMSQIRDGTLQAAADHRWDVRIRENMGELYWIE